MKPADHRYADALHRLLRIMDELRAQCPWDKQQTWETLRHLTLEEAYELSDAIVAGDVDEVRKELGDLLLHIVFYAKIASERKQFDLAVVMDSLCDKLVARHPHVYANTTAENAQAVQQNWERLKLQEKGRKPGGVLSGVPAALPSLIKALRMQEKARGVGFDWTHQDAVWEKVEEELHEFKTECHANPPDLARMEDEFGDILFSLVNFARFLHINPESALARANHKFYSRFMHMEQCAARDGADVRHLSAAQWDAYWQEAKQLGERVVTDE